MYLISEVTSLMMLPDSFKKLFWPQFSVNTEAHWPYATKVASLLGLSAPVHILSYSIKVSNDTIINTNWVPQNRFRGRMTWLFINKHACSKSFQNDINHWYKM